MGDFFNVDNKFFQGLGKIIDVICLSAFWFFLCIPIVTAGAATTALYYTVNKVIRNNRSYIGREFWHAFKTNFRQSTIVWLILLLLYAIMALGIYITYTILDFPDLTVDGSFPLRAAIFAKADVLVTGDKDFLESDIVNPKILTAAEFLDFESKK